MWLHGSQDAWSLKASKFVQPYLIPGYLYRPVFHFASCWHQFTCSWYYSPQLLGFGMIWDDTKKWPKLQCTSKHTREGHNMFITSYSVSWRQSLLFLFPISSAILYDTVHISCLLWQQDKASHMCSDLKCDLTFNLKIKKSSCHGWKDWEHTRWWENLLGPSGTSWYVSRSSTKSQQYAWIWNYLCYHLHLNCGL